MLVFVCGVCCCLVCVVFVFAKVFLFCVGDLVTRRCNSFVSESVFVMVVGVCCGLFGVCVGV